MAVPEALCAVFLVPFLVMLYITIQQFCIERIENKQWVIYRIFILISVLNEVIILIVLLSLDRMLYKTKQDRTKQSKKTEK